MFLINNLLKVQRDASLHPLFHYPGVVDVKGEHKVPVSQCGGTASHEPPVYMCVRVCLFIIILFCVCHPLFIITCMCVYVCLSLF